MAELGAKIAENNNILADINQQKAENEKALSSIASKEELLKVQKRTLKETEDDCKSFKKRYEDKLKELASKDKEIEAKEVGLESKSNDLQAKYDELSDLKTKANDLISKKADINSELTAQVNLTKASQSALSSRLVELETKEKELDKLKSSLEEAVAKANASEKSFLALQSSADVKDKQIKIRELRVIEAERRLNISNELEELTKNA